jgi:phosphopantetheinyl transferase
MGDEPQQEMTEEQQVKAFRVQADALMVNAQRLAKRFGGSRAYSLMFTHAELSKMYGGKRLEELGTEFPAALADKSTGK